MALSNSAAYKNLKFKFFYRTILKDLNSKFFNEKHSLKKHSILVSNMCQPVLSGMTSNKVKYYNSLVIHDTNIYKPVSNVFDQIIDFNPIENDILTDIENTTTQNIDRHKFTSDYCDYKSKKVSTMDFHKQKLYVYSSFFLTKKN
jgi:hypothetical protein